MENFKPIDILLVEDNPGDTRLVIEAIKEGKLMNRIHHVIDGEEATDFLFKRKKYKDAISPDIIILDINLPDSKGIKTFESLHKGYPHIPIILVSGMEDEELSLELIQLGAQDYINKSNIASRIIEKSINYSLERNKLKTNLQKSEERFKKLSMLAMQGILLHTNGIAEDVSLSFAKMFSYEIKELIGKNLIELLIPTEYHKTIANKTSDVHALPYVVEGIKKDGSLFPVEIEGMGISITNENKAQRVAIFRDITEQKRTQNDLRESEEKYRLLSENAQDWVYWIDFEGNWLYSSPSCYHLTGYSIDEFIKNPKLLEEITYQEDKELINNHLRSEISTKKEDCLEFRITKKSGEVIWVSHFCRPIFDAEKKYLGSRGTNRDITKRKRSEQIQTVLYNISNAVHNTENLSKLIGFIRKELGSIIDTTNFYTALYDSETDIISLPFIADEKEKRTSFPAGKTLTNYVIKTKKSLFGTKEKIKELEQCGDVEAVGAESEIWIGVPLKIEGKVTGVIAIQSYTDKNAYNILDLELLEFVSGQVSTSIERKKTEQELMAALEKATESDRLKSAFLANISHEIRTPMNGILGFSELLKEPKLSGEMQQEYINIIEISSNRMLSTINDIVDFSMIEAGQVDIRISSVNINEQIEFIHSFLLPEAEKKNVQFLFKNGVPIEYAIIETDR
ncbi:MAG: PAS domain S-box protein [Bacteroidetes bacterium]|nr:PAS domain S-box protein [Bacteroidota bacterium]